MGNEGRDAKLFSRFQFTKPGWKVSTAANPHPSPCCSPLWPFLFFIVLTHLLLFIGFWDRFVLCNTGWPWISDLPASVSEDSCYATLIYHNKLYFLYQIFKNGIKDQRKRKPPFVKYNLICKRTDCIRLKSCTLVSKFPNKTNSSNNTCNTNLFSWTIYPFKRQIFKLSAVKSSNLPSSEIRDSGGIPSKNRDRLGWADRTVRCL